MHLVKKIEIFVNSFEINIIIKGLDESGVHGHVVIRNVTGKGLHGSGAEDLDRILEDNAYILAFCMPEQVKPVVEHIRPLLNKFGGTCYISDVMEIRSVKCVAHQ